MGTLSNFLANRKTPGLKLDHLNLFEGKPVPTGLALLDINVWATCST